MSFVESPETQQSAETLGMRNVVAMLRLRATLQPHKMAFTFLSRGERRACLTFSDLDRKARAIAAQLQRSRGFTPGARALLLYPAGLDYIEAFFGCLYAGVIATPAYPPGGQHRQRLQAIRDDSAPAFIMTTAELEGRFSEDRFWRQGQEKARWLATDRLANSDAEEWAPYEPAPETIAFLQYTSGSTGNPRGVKVTHSNLIANEAVIRDSFKHDEQSTVVGWLPLYHDMGLIGNILQPLFVGASAYLMSPLAFLEKPVRWLQAISTYRAHTSGGPNFAYDLCVRKITQEQKINLDLRCWKVAFSGAEPVRAATLDRFAAAFAESGFETEAFFPCFGLAEGTLLVTAPTRGRAPTLRYVDRVLLADNKVAPPGDRGTIALVGCGHAWNDHHVRIVDPESLAPCADDQVGEIWVSGPSVAAGYWNRKHETAETFAARLEDAPGDRYLRTGDIGFISNGAVFITGRLKDLIIIAGRNYYPQDFERVLDETIDEVKPGYSAAFSVTIDEAEAVVVVAELERGEFRGRAPNAEEAAALFAKIRENIAAVSDVGPSEIVLVRSGTIPRTSSGKIRRAECRHLYLSDQFEVIARSLASATAPGDGVKSSVPNSIGADVALRQAFGMLGSEQRVQLAITVLISEGARILRVPPSRLDANSRLTSCGLNSLDALELKHAIDGLTGQEAPLAPFLNNETIAEIAVLVANGGLLNVPADAEVKTNGRLDLSPSQMAIWAVQRLDPRSPAYNLHLAFEIEGAVDVAALEEASDHLVERHPLLRTVYPEDSHCPIQQRSPAITSYFTVVAAQEWPDAALQADMSARILEPFDLARGPLLRIVIYTRSGRHAAALMCAHHISVDLWSMLIFATELEEAYRAAREGRRLALPAIDVDYADFVIWARRYRDSDACARDWAYWRKQLEGELPQLALPADRTCRSPQTSRGSTLCLRLDTALTARVRDIASAEGVTLFVLLLAIYKLFLYRCTNERDIIVGSATSGRSQGRFAPIVGNFVNPVALRTRIDPCKAFVNYLYDVRRCVAEAVAHQDFPFSMLVERLNPARVEGQWPIFQTLFVLHQPQAGIAAELTALALGESTRLFGFADWKIGGIAVETRAERFDLKLMAAESNGELALSFQYRQDIFSRDTIARLASYFQALLEQVTAAAPTTPIGALAPLPAAATSTDLVAFSLGAPRDLEADFFAHRLLSASAARSPEKIALVCGNIKLTYRVIETRANRLAHVLREMGVDRGTRVGVCAERSVDAVIAMFAVMKAGGAYVAVDADFPSLRISRMLRLASARKLLCAQSWFLNKSLDDVEPVFFEPLGAQTRNETVEAPRFPLDPSDLAYVVFTSGSSGDPKGVAVPHRALANYVAAINSRLGEQGFSFALASTLAADLGYTMLYPCFASGGRLHVLTDEEATVAGAFAAAIKDNDIEVLKIAPSQFGALLMNDAQGDSIPRKALIFGGEALPASLVRDVTRKAQAASPRLDQLRIFNHYGPTETAIGVLMTPVELPALDAMGADIAPIGQPLENARVYVLSPDSTPTLRGVRGEICIGGTVLARGYLERPDLTAERFVPDPYGPLGARLYRTGDLGVLRSDGALQFLGRIDAQVKIRGFRVEPGEVEARLCEYVGLRQAAVLAHVASDGRTMLAAYAVVKDGAQVTAQELSAHLRRMLPEYMIPSAFVFLDTLPITKNGKIDRKRLPAIDARQMQSIYRAPEGETETRLAAIFADVLRIERIGADDNFFALGGDSILSIQAASRAAASGLQVTPRMIFRHQSVAELAAALMQDSGAPVRTSKPVERTTPDSEKIESDEFEDFYATTPLQEGLLFHTLSRPNSGVYIMQHRYWIEGDVDAEHFRSAWQAIAAAHATFRTSFSWETTKQCLQRVRRRVILPFEYLDWRDQAPQVQEQKLTDILAKERRDGFDLAKAPLLRIRLLRLAERRYLLIRSHHHILFDAWCTSLILEELQSNYAALAAGRSLPRRRKPDFKQYIDWLDGRDARSAESFWRATLEGFRDPTVLRGRPRGVDDIGEESIEDLVLHLSKEDTRALRALARRLRVTENSFVQAALTLLLANYTSQRDVVFGVTVAGRPPDLPGVESMIGLFINALPLRIPIDMSEKMDAFLQRTLAHNYAMRDFEYSSLVQVQSWSEIPRGVDLFQVLLTFENAPVDPSLYEGNEHWRFTDCWHRTHTNYPLTFVVIPGERLHIQLTYTRAWFDRATAERLLSEYRGLLEEMVRNPDRRIGEVALVSGAERRKQLEHWNRTGFDYAEPRDVIKRFEAQVLANPQAIAAICGDERITYEALNGRANHLAHALIHQGIEPDAIVLLFEDRGIDFLAAMLGIFKAGAGYLPIDPAHPDGRITQIFEESRVVAALVGERHVERANRIADGLDKRRPHCIRLQSALKDHPLPGNPAPRHGPENAAFVIFTSGTTGNPKGAVVQHKGMFNNLVTKIPALGLTAADVIAQTASQCFDISVWQFLTALTLGASVEIFPDEVSQDPHRLLREIARRGVTILETVPSMIKALLDVPEPGDGLKGLRWLLPCGEAFTPELCRRFMAAYPQMKLLNAYGPAECSDDVSYYPIEDMPTGNELSVPIGRPVNNTQLYVLNCWFAPAPIGAKGEICVGGVQVGRGYLNRPELTAAAFVPNPYGPPGTRLYRTGDLGAFRDDGVIEFHGRTDHQVKIRGFRVEPGEVEACMILHPQVEQVCVVAIESAKGVYRLIAYVVGKGFDAASLRKHLLQQVPDYLVPSAFVFIESMPLTPNGKIDRAKLPVADVDQHLATRYIAPRNELEQALCRIWAEVLSVPKVGVEHNFFELGGHSLLAIQIRSRIKGAFNIDLPLRNLFDEPTVAQLATRIELALIEEVDSLDDEEAAALTQQIRRRADGEPR